MIKFRWTLRRKLLFFSVILAIIPLLIAGRTMIRLTQDELKSAANDELSLTADKLAKEIDSLYEDTWRAPLLLIRKGLDNEQLGVEEKISFLTSIREISDVLSLQLDVEGAANPMMVMQDDFVQRLGLASPDVSSRLKLTPEKLSSLRLPAEVFVGDLDYIPEVDSWMISIIVPLKKTIGGRAATLSARISLGRLRDRFENHPFNKTGRVALVDMEGRKIFDPQRPDMKAFEVVETALRLLRTNARAIGIQPYTRPSGEKMLGAFSFPRNFSWAVISERTEADAYLAVRKMNRNLVFWILIGFSVAGAGAVFFARRISRPILEVGRVAHLVGTGDFSVRVGRIRSNDEIRDLADRINIMIGELRERFELQKFVSGNTIDAIRRAKGEGIKLGGERRTATVFFSDIRGFTEFAEKVEPEEVIEMLNTYLSCQARIVRKYGGDIDKFVGDELVAVFKGEDMVQRAVLCAVEIHGEIGRLNAAHPKWNIPVGIGINTGDVVIGATGSEDRMEYTVLGDTVNLGSRLCSIAGPHQTIVSEGSYRAIAHLDWITVIKLNPVQIKGKEHAVQIYEVKGVRENPPS